MKLPKFPKMFPLKPRKRLNAATAARRAPIEDYDDEPQTKLSSAFVVVLILHIVAVGGIYAFNSIKAHRKAEEPVAPIAPLATAPIAKSLPQPAAQAPKQEIADSTPAVPPPAPVTAPISGARVHHVKAGDNLTKIAAQYSVTPAEIEELNGAKNVATLRIGQTLNIPKPHAAAALPKKTEEPIKVAALTKGPAKTYVVAKGDNPVAIARKLGVSYDELLKLNNIEDPKKLQIGQTLKVPAKK